MKKRLALLALLFTVVVSATPAHAVRLDCFNKAIAGLVASSNTTSDTAHLLYLYPCSDTIGGTVYSLCTGNVAYIEFADKEIYTQALTAVSKGLSVNASIDLSATSKGSAVHGTNTCKVVSLWY